ncbi:MAG: transglutaminase family protein [Chloroflexi bacterium]|nr:transglutaminase family protein [Chloroflexota bacterium]
MQADPLRSSDPGAAITARYTYRATYAYGHEVTRNENVLRIAPRVDDAQYDAACEVRTTPDGEQTEDHDEFGNRVLRSVVTCPHREMTVDAAGSVAVRLGREPVTDLRMEVYRERLLPAGVYLAGTALVDPIALAEQARVAAGGATSLLETVQAVTAWLHRRMVYERGHTSVFTTAEEAIARGYGVCQDYTHAAIGLLRALGIPTRYVSGLLASQVGETHAWIEFQHPDQGWLTADPTRLRMLPPPTELLTFAVGRDYNDARPSFGSFDPPGEGGLVSVEARVQLGEEG